MKGLAAFVMRGPAHAGSVAGAGMLAGFVVPPFAWLSAAVVALVVLRLGEAALARMALPALAAVVLVGGVIWGQPGAVTIAGLGAWAPAIVVAGALRRRARLDDALLVACVLGWVLVLGIHLALTDPAATWQQTLTQLFPPERLGNEAGVEAGALARFIERVAPLMTGLIAASLVFSSVTSVLLARWWQALLDRPGAFGQEFHALRLGRIAAMLAAGLCLAAALTQAQLLVGLALVAVTIYLFQGLAVVHGVVAGRGMARGWLAALYVLAVMLPPQVVVGVALVGLADAWADFRGRVIADPS